MKTTVVYHRADFDGIFCREIARRFLKDAEFIGWDFGDPFIQMPQEGTVYILDLSPDCLDARNVETTIWNRIVWIDHHKSSIEKYSNGYPPMRGVRIDGVAACRLTWQWFTHESGQGDKSEGRPFSKEDYVERRVTEPLAVRLAGEYDIWDKRDPRVDTFQFGLRSDDWGDPDWSMMLDSKAYEGGQKCELMDRILRNGELLQRYQKGIDQGVVKRGFDVEFEGKKFLALNTARCNSLTFESAAQPQHDGLMGFYWDGSKWRVSLYHSPHHKEHDLSQIAVKYGGGGHRGACGFMTDKLPFVQ